MQAENVEALFSRSGSAVPVSADIDAQARINESLIVNRLNLLGHASVAGHIGKDVSTISKWISNGDVYRTGLMLALLGIKVVPKDWQVMDPAQVGAMLVLAQVQVAGLTVEKLVQRVPT